MPAVWEKKQRLRAGDTAGFSRQSDICHRLGRIDLENRKLMTTVTLYRPVGAKELELIATTEYRAFPPRLPDQPIFYPVLTREYAEQIARDWNTKDERAGFVGYVLEFDVDADYLSKFEVKKVGATQHLELWVLAEELPEFNRHIRGAIRVIDRFPKA